MLLDADPSSAETRYLPTIAVLRGTGSRAMAGMRTLPGWVPRLAQTSHHLQPHLL